MKFSYSAKNDQGELKNGTIESFSEESAIDLLQKAGFVILKIEKAKEQSISERAFSFLSGVKIKDLAIFTRQMATLFEAQVSIRESLLTTREQTENQALKEAIYQVYSDIESGLTFSDSLSKYPDVFGTFYVNMIKAAEITGRLDSALNYLADYYDTQSAINSKIKNAMIYPLFMIAMFGVVISIMVSVVIPQLSGVISDSGVGFSELPIATQMLFKMGDFFQSYWYIVISFFLGIVYLLFRYFSSEEGKMMAGSILLGMPIIGEFLRKVYVARFAETFSVLLKGNIPVAQAIEISSQVVGSAYYEEIIFEVARGVRQGKSISEMLAVYSDYFPPLVSQMVAVGEKTGRLDDLLSKLSKFYSREVELLVDSLTEIIQPVLIVVLGVLIGGLIGAVILPIYQIAQQF